MNNKYTPMTVGELIAKLQQHDEKSEVAICGFSLRSCITAESLLVEKRGAQVIIFGANHDD